VCLSDLPVTWTRVSILNKPTGGTGVKPYGPNYDFAKTEFTIGASLRNNHLLCAESLGCRLTDMESPFHSLVEYDTEILYSTDEGDDTTF
jgi:hypothetical protein